MVIEGQHVALAMRKRRERYPLDPQLKEISSKKFIVPNLNFVKIVYFGNSYFKVFHKTNNYDYGFNSVLQDLYFEFPEEEEVCLIKSKHIQLYNDFMKHWVYHRLDGPALKFPYHEFYYINGVEYNKSKFDVLISKPHLIALL